MPAAGATPRFSPGRSLLYSTLLVVAFFSAVEGILRLAGVGVPAERPRILLREMDSDIVLPFVRPDREVFWSPRPGFHGEFKGSPVSINSLGLRGPELARPRPVGRRRIACFGDSITFGFGVGDDETYSHLLGRLLAPRDVEVVNAGVTGFTSHQVLGWLRRVAPQAEPDVVTVLVGWNDQNRRPLTDRDYEARLRRARVVEGPLDRLRLYAAMKALYSRLGTGREPAAGSVERVPPEHFRENLLAIASLCRSRNIRPVFVALPHRKGPGEPRARTPYESLLAETALQAGAPLLDVGELGLATSVEDNSGSFIDALHLSVAGNALMARRLAEQLAALGMVPGEDAAVDRPQQLTDPLKMSRLEFKHLPREGVMAEAILDIKQWGNNLGVRLPAAVAREARLHVDQRVRVAVEGDHVVITPVKDSRLTLEQRLAAYDPKRHGGEQMATTRTLGAERW